MKKTELKELCENINPNITNPIKAAEEAIIDYTKGDRNKIRRISKEALKNYEDVFIYMYYAYIIQLLILGYFFKSMKLNTLIAFIIIETIIWAVLNITWSLYRKKNKNLLYWKVYISVVAIDILDNMD